MGFSIEVARGHAAVWAADAVAWLSRQPLAAVAFGAAFAMGAIDLALHPEIMYLWLGDTDDATRLTEVRELIAGQPWFDMRLTRFGGANPLVSHWSRIIDLPIAALIMLFSTLMSQDTAELVTRMLWPTLMNGVIGYCVAAYCEQLTNRSTALLALALAIPGTGHFQFTPGRIDHHNAMIIGAVGGTLALLLALERPRLGWLAGVLLGLGCAVGYEGLGLTLATLAMITLVSIFITGRLDGIARAGAAFAATLTAAYLVFGPGHPDGLVVCDALSTNLVALAICAAAGVGLAHKARMEGASQLAAFGFVAAAGLVGLFLYGLTQPVCFAGPFAQIEPRLVAIWLQNVNETRSLFGVASYAMIDAISVGGYPLVGLGYGYLVWRRRDMPFAGVYFAIFLVTLVLGLWQIRLLPYASFLSAPLIAIGLTRRGEVAAPVVLAAPVSAFALPNWAVAGGLGAAIITVGIVMLSGGPQAATTPADTADAGAAVNFTHCLNADNVKPLAALPKGLVANDIDIGPYLVAWTNLDVLSAPYHRMGRTILATHDLFHASASEAELRMKALGARYIILCSGEASGTRPVDPVPGDALRSALLAGHGPDVLEPIVIGKGKLKVWRLRD